jgi:hypothetical protein
MVRLYNITPFRPVRIWKRHGCRLGGQYILNLAAGIDRSPLGQGEKEMKRSFKLSTFFGAVIVAAFSMMSCVTIPPVSTAFVDTPANSKQQALLVMQGVVPGGIITGMDGTRNATRGSFHQLKVSDWSKVVADNQVAFIPAGDHELYLYITNRNAQPVTKEDITIKGNFEAGKKYVLWYTYTGLAFGSTEVNKDDVKLFTYDDFLKFSPEDKAKVDKKFAAAEAYLANPPANGVK